MKAPPFAYVRAETLAQVFGLLGRYGDEAELLAGGQSLLPALNLRLASPAVLIDINRLDGLAGIRIDGARLRIGALTRHAALERSALLARECPLLARAIPHVAHPAVRNRGTLGGSIALADPAAELPACALALGADILLAGAGGERRVPAAEFFLGLYQTARRPDEVITALELPRAGADSRDYFEEFSRRHGDYAVAGVACRARQSGTGIEELRLVVFGCSERPRLTAAVLRDRELDDATVAELAADIAGQIEPLADLHGDSEFKRRLVASLGRRALRALRAPSGAPRQGRRRDGSGG